MKKSDDMSRGDQDLLKPWEARIPDWPEAVPNLPILTREEKIARVRAIFRARPAALAPMSGLTDSPFRRIARRHGAAFTVTELLSAEGMRRGGKQTLRMALFHEEERPVGIQLFGADPTALAEAAERVTRLSPDFVDLNFGCPVKKVVKTQAGSALLADVPLLARVVRAVVDATPLPVTAKIRAGWDHKSVNVEEVGHAVEEAGAAGMMIHARTRAQGFTGHADWTFIARLKAAVALPVMGNGDVVDVAGVRRMLETTGADGVYIGRGAVGNPWIFDEINASFEARSYEAPEWEARRAVLLEHLEMLEWEKGTRVALNEIRTPLAGYLRGFRGASSLRKRLFETKTLGEFREILVGFEIPPDLEGLAWEAARGASRGAGSVLDAESVIRYDETCPSEAAILD